VTFTVRWTPEAEEQLAAVWMAASSRNAITQDAYDIELVLEVFASTAGEVSFDIVREYTHGSLTVEFEVDEVDRSVLVLSVWSTADGRPDVTGH
jgi:hypothetical protein